MDYCQVTALSTGRGLRKGDVVWLDDDVYRVTDKPDMLTFNVIPEWEWSNRQFERFLFWLAAGTVLFYGYVGLWHFLG